MKDNGLTAHDYSLLEARWIDRQTADSQYIYRVDSLTGACLLNRNGKTGDCAGLALDNIWPGESYRRTVRVRRDRPDVENGKVKAKYLGPPGEGNRLYFAASTDPELLYINTLPIVVTEGEFKTIALARVASHGCSSPRFLAMGLYGVWNWRGKVGKTTDAYGERIDEHGPIPDLSRIPWDERPVLIVFDRDIESNDSVKAARRQLTHELQSRGAQVYWFAWPENEAVEAKGIDDLLAAIGPDKVLEIIEDAFSRPAGPPDLLHYGFNDVGNADRLIALYGADLRYCPAMRKWLVWDGTRWRPDEIQKPRHLAKLTIVTFLKQALDARDDDLLKFAKASLEKHRLDAMLSLAEPELPITPSELDTDPCLLNAVNGTVDLRTGRMRPHCRRDFITKVACCEYHPEARCDRWLGFLDEAMGAGPDAGQGELDRAERLTNYLQVALGYSMTGLTTEKAVFVPFGSGNNGKTTMLATFRHLLNDYAALIQVDTLMTRQENSNTQADLADLRGARFVQTSETEQGQRLAQSKLKRITQGMGTIKAVRKYENPIEFRETHKLWLDTNRRPSIHDTEDPATFSRLHPIPFLVQIAPERIDRELPRKLLAEASGILAWAAAGAKKWFACGLQKPPEVVGANDDWREENDRLAPFLEEMCCLDVNATVPCSQFYREYHEWAEAQGERPLTANDVGRKLSGRGIERRHREKGNWYVGIDLRSNRKCA